MGSFSILNNIAGLSAQNQLNLNNINLARTFQRLSSGKRINSGADDAAGLQIADSLRANIRALDQAVRNANDGISVAQIADGALQEITNLLTRAVTLAEEAATETTDATGRTSLNNEFSQIEAEIARIASQTSFNGVALFTASGVNGSLSVFVGDTASASSISVSITTITANSTAGTVTSLGGQRPDFDRPDHPVGCGYRTDDHQGCRFGRIQQPRRHRRRDQPSADGRRRAAGPVPEHPGRGIDHPRRQHRRRGGEPDQVSDSGPIRYCRPGAGQR